jgi:hypothetical protein
MNGEVIIPGELTLPTELILMELVSNNVSCTHRNDDGKFTILHEKTGYTCTLCGDKHDKISDFFVDNMAQGQLKEEEERNDA